METYTCIFCICTDNWRENEEEPGRGEGGVDLYPSIDLVEYISTEPPKNHSIHLFPRCPYNLADKLMKTFFIYQRTSHCFIWKYPPITARKQSFDWDSHLADCGAIWRMWKTDENLRTEFFFMISVEFSGRRK